MSISRNQRAGLVVLGVTAVVVVGVVVAGAVSWNGSDLRSRPRSGPTWCQEQASNRPIINLVNEAAIGGNAWQSDRAMLFGADCSGRHASLASTKTTWRVSRSHSSRPRQVPAPTTGSILPTCQKYERRLCASTSTATLTREFHHAGACVGDDEGVEDNQR